MSISDEASHPPIGKDARGDDGGAIAHLPALDGIRGIAIALVLMIHFGVGVDLPGRLPIPGADWLQRIFFTGWSGVDLFFVLSGYLISSILLASRDQPHYYRRFYARRALRIFPLYYAALVVGLVLAPWALQGRAPGLLEQAAEGQVWLWTYTFNVGVALGYVGVAGMLGHFWTLTIEEQFYLVWPWVVRSFTPSSAIRICGLLVVGALGLRLAWLAVGDWEGAYRFTFTRVDALALGALIAFLAREARWRARLLRVGPPGLATGLATLALVFLAVPRFYPSDWLVVTFGHTLLALTFGCLLLVGLRDPAPAWLSGPTLRALGRYSYGIYVWHWPLQRALLSWYGSSAAQAQGAAPLEALAFLVGGVGGSVFVGWGSYHLLEQPFLRLKRLFAYRTERSRWDAKPEESAPVAPTS